MRRSKKYAHPYFEWEDYKRGMYNDAITEQGIKYATEILGNPILCKNAMERVLKEYKCAAETNILSDMIDEYHSDRAWLGAAACNIAYGCTVAEVRNAWWLLTDEQRNIANQIADQCLEKWKSNYLGYKQFSLFEEEEL